MLIAVANYLSIGSGRYVLPVLAWLQFVEGFNQLQGAKHPHLQFLHGLAPRVEILNGVLLYHPFTALSKPARSRLNQSFRSS